MSQLGKILLGIAAAGAITALIFGWLLIGKYNESKQDLQTATTAKAAAQAEAAKQKKLAEEAAEKAADSDKKAADASAKADDLTTQLAAAQKQVDDGKTALAAATDAAQKAKDALDAVTKDLPSGMTVDDLVAAKAKAEKDLETSESEKKILEDSVQAALAQVDQLKKDINNKNLGILPPGVSGKVTFVNPTWNFVVLNVGLANGVVPNGELIVYRGKSFLGKIKVTSAETNSSVADILPDVQGSIQVGDSVLN